MGKLVNLAEASDLQNWEVLNEWHLSRCADDSFSSSTQKQMYILVLEVWGRVTNTRRYGSGLGTRQGGSWEKMEEQDEFPRWP